MTSFLLVAGLAGCAHRDVVDTPVGWFHQLEGGAIAQQRPPPPGADDPYPKIGTTPAHAPAVASLDLRHSVTGALLRQRNLTTRLDANDPIPEAVPPPPAPAAPVPAAPTASSSASLDAAQTTAKAAPAVPPDLDAEPELALPAVQVQAAAGEPVVMPAIPGAPPASPHLPGLVALAGRPTAGKLPDYRTEPVTGTQIGFSAGTDTMLGGQLGALHAIAARRGTGTMHVVGYGDAAAADPETQSQALSVAALRARTVAEALQSEGVPAGSILLRAEAFGRGASVSLVQ